MTEGGFSQHLLGCPRSGRNCSFRVQYRHELQGGNASAAPPRSKAMGRFLPLIPLLAEEKEQLLSRNQQVH